MGFARPVENLERRVLMAASPVVLSIVRTGSPITSSPTLGYTVTFDQAVTGVDPTDFKVVSDGTVVFSTPVSVSGSGSSYNVNINGVRGNGHLQLELVDDDSVQAGGNALGGPGAGNGSFIGQTYSVLEPFPTVLSINRTDPSGLNSFNGSVTYTVTFSTAVTGVDPTDFQVVTTGGVTASSPVVVSGSGASYSVTVNGITGAGSLGLNLIDDGTIHDTLGNPLQSNVATATSFQSPRVFGPGPQPTTMTVADLNGDGKPDIVEATGLVIGVMLGNGNATFQPLQTVSTSPAAAYAIAVADMNGDGIPDLVVANEHVNSTGILLGNGNGTFNAETTFATGSFPASVVVADVNGDGKADVVVPNLNNNNVSVLLGNGDGTLQARQNFSVGFGPRSVTVTDVSGDGNLDIVAANGGSNTVSVLLGNGNGSFSLQHTFLSGGGPYYIASADVNGDGTPDLVTANTLYANVNVLLGNGMALLSRPSIFPRLAFQTL
jgi:hypothetical protein